MGIVSGHRIIHNLMAGSLTGAQLAAYLATGSNKASYQQAILSRSQNRALAASALGIEAALSAGVLVGSLLNQIAIRGGAAHTPELEAASDMNAVAASTTAMNAVIASTTAMNAVIASTTAMNAVAASTTAMNAVAASTTAMNAVIASTTAKMACFNSDTALDAFAGSATALAALRAAAQYSVLSTSNSTGTTSRAFTTAVNGASYIVVGASTSDASTGATMSFTTKRAGSTRNATHLTAASSTGLTTALGECVFPMVQPFNGVSTDSGIQTFYIGVLRCDI